MFDKKSVYALNKKNPNAIVYTDVSGVHTLLTPDQFSGEEEFRFWKDVSDSDYRTREQKGRGYDDRSVPLTDADTGGDSLEDVIFAVLEEREYRSECAKWVMKIRNVLSKKQFRRLWLHEAAGKTEQEIAVLEGVSQQAVAKSIRASKEKIKKIFHFISKKGCKIG